MGLKRKPKRREKDWTFFGAVKKSVAGIVALLSAWLVILTLFPRISVVPGVELAAGDPFSTAFNVKNDGFLSLYEVGSKCSVGNLVFHVKGAEPPNDTLTIVSHGDQEPLFALKDGPFKADELSEDGAFDVICAFPSDSGHTLLEGNIGIVVIFRPYYLSWWHAERIYRFATVRDRATGEVHWVSRGAKWVKRF